jgi:gliding motility-associated-like protein
MKTAKSIWLHSLQLMVLAFITTTASAQLHADFSATPVSGCPPMVVVFNDNTAGNPTSWKWDLGNGTISHLQSPIATYFNPGTYSVKLVATNANGADSVIKTDYIVVNAVPTAAFGASDTTGCFPLKVEFSDSSLPGSGSIQSWQWDFGDGTLSKQQNPSHTYTSAGVFTVILRITNSNGCTSSITKRAYINIPNGIKADFSYSATNGCHTPAAVNFTNKTAGLGNLHYTWDFGDGNTSTDVNPVNNYKSGIYSVKLIASNETGCSDTVIKANAIDVGFVHADFSSVDSICVGSSLQFINASTPSTFTGASWDFGDSTFSTEINPRKTFLTPGVHQVKMIANFGSCADSISKPITVVAKPNVGFTASSTITCSAPFNVSFRDTSSTGNGETYRWSFGDNTTSTLQNPDHVYQTSGRFTVSLTVTNAFGCARTMVKDSLIKIAPLQITSISKLGVKGCLPVTVSPVANIRDNLPISSYFWDFGDGFTSTDALPSHTYTTPGVFDVKLIVATASGCTDTLIVSQAVKAGNKPHAAFSADPRDVCASVPVIFTDNSTGAQATDWFWTFGDGGTSTLQTPNYTYNDTGYFKVSLVAFNYGCSDTLNIDRYIHVKPPIAKFETSFICSDPLKRSFINKSIGATSYNWDFGDGTGSTVAEPSHTYASAGVYNVILKASNDQCEHYSAKKMVVINEQGSLAISDSANCVNTRIVFNVKNIVDSNIVRYNWYLNGISGDAIVTTNNPIAWSFSTPGVRPAAVVLTDKLNCKDTLYTSVPIKSYGPIAGFGSLNSNTCYGNTINFIDSTKADDLHPIKEYLWNFGDGAAQSFAQGPFSHNYSITGTYTVRLSVTDTYGCKDSITKAAFVSITKPIAKFTPSDTVLCPALPITFINQSSGVTPTYLWDFGDGTTSNQFSPSHTYPQAGTYFVRMVMIDKNGCKDSASTTIKVYTAKADFSLSDSFSTCPPLVVNIANQSTNYVSLNWDFGDGGNSQLQSPSHIYTYPGHYTVTLSVLNNGGCADTLMKKVVIQGPMGNFDYKPKEICNPGKVDFTASAKNTVNYIWDFSDGNTVYTTTPSASHLYTTAGVYVPKIILEDGSGCKVAIKGNDTITVHGIHALMTSNTTLLCDSGFVAFKDSSLSDDIIAHSMWDFGDGTTSALPTPAHTYTDTGYYSVKLISTTKFGCTDSIVTGNYVKVVSSPQIKMIGDTTGCEPVKLQFGADVVQKDSSAIKWDWAFGNGNFSSEQIPDSQSYAHSGTYLVTVKATNSSGCEDVITNSVVIHPKPNVNAGADATICRFTTLALQPSGADTYTWRAQPTLSCSTCASPVASPDSTTTYAVTGTTLFGCSNDDSVTITVRQPFRITVNNNDTLCKGQSAKLVAMGADEYKWYPSLYLDNANISSPTSRPDSSITYRVIGQDTNGCFKDTGEVSIDVFPIPTVNITNGSKVNVQAGGTIKLTTKSSPDVVNWQWTPEHWISCGSCSETISAPKGDITYEVTATNAGKCTAKDQVTINVICDNQNVYIPNTFSPNGDGANDIFYPRGSGLYKILTFKVFNRWGQLVFQKNGIGANNPADGWDGTLNGAPLQSDVYVYLVEVECSTGVIFPFKGNVSLIR